jgi:hypothetical protein
MGQIRRICGLAQGELNGSQSLVPVVAQRCHSAWNKREQDALPRKEGDGMRLIAQGIRLQLLKGSSCWKMHGKERHTICQDGGVHLTVTHIFGRMEHAVHVRNIG